MSIKPDPRYLEECARTVDRLMREISTPGSKVTNADVDRAQDAYNAALLAASEPSKFDEVAFIMAYESGELEHDEIVEGFQHLIDSGTVWHLQGFYGRAARNLINAGLCSAKES